MQTRITHSSALRGIAAAALVLIVGLLYALALPKTHADATSTSTSTLSGTVLSSTTTASTTTPSTSASDLNAFIVALRNLESNFPTFAGRIEAFIAHLLNASTPPGMLHAIIDQNGQTKMAGDQIDFGGHGFQSDEHVIVTLNGQIVTTAFADDGGNFSTGSQRLPSIAGTYTYMFQGANGDSAQATITVR